MPDLLEYKVNILTKKADSYLVVSERLAGRGLFM